MAFRTSTKRRERGIILLFALLFVFNAALHAEEEAAFIKGIAGTVEIQRKNENLWKAAANNMSLYAEDTLRTKLKSEAQIVFRPGGHNIKIAAFTTIQIKVPRKPKKNEPKNVSYTSDAKVNVGKIFAKVKKTVGAPTKFEVATPTVLVGVRGTLLSVEVEEDGDTACSVLDGIVEMESDTQSITIMKGEEVSVDAVIGEIPGEAAPMSQEEKKEWQNQQEWIQQTESEVEGKLPVEDTGKSSESTASSTGTGASPSTSTGTTTTSSETTATTDTKEASSGTTTTTTSSETTAATETKEASPGTTTSSESTGATETKEASPETMTETSTDTKTETPFVETVTESEVNTYSPVNEITSDSDLIKNVESENKGETFDPQSEAVILPSEAVENTILQEDGFGNVNLGQETFTE